MGEHTRVYDYFYTRDLEIMNFYMIPKVLVKDKYFSELSNEAKMVYGLLIDRTHLSDKNGWADAGGQLYIIYTTEELMDDLNVSKRTVIKLMAELDSEKGYGLIERVKQGFGLPNRIYVKNVTKIRSGNGRKCTAPNRPVSEVQNLQECGLKSAPNEVQNLHPNYTDIINTEYSYTNNYTERYDKDESAGVLPPARPPILKYSNIQDLESQIKRQIDYNNLVKMPKDESLVDGMVEMMVEAFYLQQDFRIGNKIIPADFVQYRFSKLRRDHLEYVADVIRNTTEPVDSMRNYLFSLLFNSVTSMDAWYQNKVNHDMRR